ncbi:MAG: hypothetical protein ACJ71C_05025, partial [Nitrososphaeraceae archaeon]
IIPADDKNNIDWNEVVKKEASGINDANFGEVQLIMGDTLITEKGIADKDRFYLPKSLIDRFDGHNLWFRIAKDEANSKYRDIEQIL